MAIFRKSKAEGPASEMPESMVAGISAPGPATAPLPMSPGGEPAQQEPQIGELVQAMREAAAASLAAGVLATRDKAGIPGAIRLWRQAYLQMYGEALPGPAVDKDAADAAEPAATE